MSTPGQTIDIFIDAVEAAEARAKADHVGGTCHLSEWSCSWCEAEQDAS